MSSEDVIELGSSDEETEPAPKKSKPMPSAMMCIPRKLHEVTIKPAKPNPTSIAKELGKAITVKKIVNSKPQIVIKKNHNGTPLQQHRTKLAINPYSGLKPVIVQNKLSNSKISFLKPSNQNIVMKPVPLLKKPIKIQNPEALHLLPPSITVKKTMSNRPIVMLNVKNKQQINQRSNTVGEVLTVELDDDETPEHNSSPQWYVRPEDQVEPSNLEEQNNKEPETPKLIEITIEDSPVKPVLNKRTHEVGAELAITIDDSPVKAVAEKHVASGSDNEDDSSSIKVPHSKKKLEYPKETDSSKTVEIEIDAFEINVNSNSSLKNTTEDVVVSLVDDDKNSNDLVRNESSEKSMQTKSDSITVNNKIEVQNSSLSEFQPVYQSFINLCFQLENSDDMKKIVEKKIKGYYRQVPKSYTESEEFTDMVTSKILSMKAGPEKMYLYIKDIVDELNLQRKLAKAQPVIKETKDEEPMQIYAEESEYDSKRQRQIRKLEKTIKKLHRAIQKLEEQEVDFDDDDDSVYLLTERYKERMVRVYAKFCQLSNTKMPSEPRVQIDARPGQPSGPAKRLEKWINKKVPIGTPLPFPDFHDVLRCVREANDEDKLNFNEADIMEEARDLFTRCGKKLQRRRQENEWRLAASRIAAEVNPAENNEELQRKLFENQKVAALKESEIFNKYADRQNQLKLEAVEIGDKEAEESPVESEDEEVNDESASLENTEKRKERLKRLLQEKSKRTSDEKENQPANKGQNDQNDVTSMDVDTASKAETEELEKKEGEDIKDNVEESKDDGTTTQHATETLTLSDSSQSRDSNDLESDIDELHLLQKLHSGNEEQSSTVDSSDSESPINISDSIESSDENGKADDVISIENSSYSENEGDKIKDTQQSNADSLPKPDSETTGLVEKNITDAECTNAGNVLAPAQTNNGEYSEAVEDILLASSDEDNCDSQDETVDACVNLRDDLISIDETIIGNINKSSDVQEEVSNTIGVDKENEIGSVEVNIDINVMSTKCDEVIKESEQSKTESQAETSQNLVDEPMELMDVDEDDNININKSQTSTTQKDNL